MTMGTMSKCAFRSPHRKLVGAVYGNDIVLGGPPKLIIAVHAGAVEESQRDAGATDGRKTD